MDEIFAVNALRALALDAVAKAKEGHPGAPLGLAPLAYVLWTKILKFNPKNPNWLDRDRVVLSAGHASMLLYGALYLTGYNLSLEEIKNFRQWDSKTPGHPEFGHTPGVETTTGPLGQGFANAVGMALAEAHLAARFNQENLPIFDHFTYCICSDGDLMEGISHEAASLAGHLALKKLIALYDDNAVSLDGPAEWSFSEDVTKRFEAYGWSVLEVKNADSDLDSIEKAILTAQKSEKPTIIRLKTTIGYGLPKQGTSATHGKAPTLDEVKLAKEKLGWSFEPFEIPDVARRPWLEAGQRGLEREKQWSQLLTRYRENHGQLAEELDEVLSGSCEISQPDFASSDGVSQPLATRQASQMMINSSKMPALIGGSADLSSSNLTEAKEHLFIKKGEYSGRNIHFGVREHAMAAISNGLALSHLRPYVATFLTFSDYLKNALRLSALMHQPVIYIFTHDSIGLGSDGPTHQPIEHLAGLRAIPGLWVLRPADAFETAFAWQMALERHNGPTALILSRQNLPLLRSNPQAQRGGYVIAEAQEPKLILIATGSEVHLALEAKKELEKQNIATRVVSLMSWEIFSQQPKDYRDSVLLPNVPKLSIEAAATFGWERWADAMIGIDHFGASASGERVLAEFGFNVENVVEQALKLITAFSKMMKEPFHHFADQLE